MNNRTTCAALVYIQPSDACNRSDLYTISLIVRRRIQVIHMDSAISTTREHAECSTHKVKASFESEVILELTIAVRCIRFLVS